MRNRDSGIIILVIAVSFFAASLWVGSNITLLNNYLHKDCPLPANVCPYMNKLPVEEVVLISISSTLVLFGSYLLIKDRKRKVDEEEMGKIKGIIASLNSEEKSLLSVIKQSNNTIYQSELVEKTGINKVRMTRVLDKMESKGLVERKRRGMSNVIVSKV